MKPYTDATVKRLAEQGTKSIAVITPGFSADCLETLEEIGMENAEIFRHAGGENFAAIPCLNDSAAGHGGDPRHRQPRAERLDLGRFAAHARQRLVNHAPLTSVNHFPPFPRACAYGRARARRLLEARTGRAAGSLAQGCRDALRALCRLCRAGGGQASAQTAMVVPDPLAPNLQTNPRQPPRFQQSRASDARAGGTAHDIRSAGFGRRRYRVRRHQRSQDKAQAKPEREFCGRAVGAHSADRRRRSLPPYQTPPPGERKSARRHAAGRDDRAGRPAEEAQGACRAGGSLRAARHSRRQLRSVPRGRALGRLRYQSRGRAPAPAQGATVFTVAPELKAQSNWSRHELKADLRGSYTWYSPDQTPTLIRPYFNGKVDGRIDVTRDTRIDLETRLLVSTDNPNSPNLQAGLAKLPIFATFGGSAGVGQKFNRFDLSLEGDAERTAYQQSQLTDGTTASNDDRNFDQYGGRLRGGYELSPGVTPFVEFEADTRVHDLNTDFSGYQRDFKGLTGKAGATFEISKLLHRRGRARLYPPRLPGPAPARHSPD